jgi:hypothetical protein
MVSATLCHCDEQRATLRKGEIFKSLELLELYKKFVVEENLIPPRRSVYLND